MLGEAWDGEVYVYLAFRSDDDLDQHLPIRNALGAYVERVTGIVEIDAGFAAASAR